MSTTTAPPTRESILAALQRAIEPQPWAKAMWEAGSVAFGRADEWSDIDLQICVDDDFVAPVFELVEQTLLTLAPIELKYELPQPTWHGHAQTFYQLHGPSPFLLIDLAVVKLSAPEKFLQPELHGHARVLFDKANVTTDIPAFDWPTHRAMLARRVEELRLRFELFGAFGVKELYRRRPIDALVCYEGLCLRPLVELLRIHHCPERYSFGPRYLFDDLPPEIYARLQPLFFVAQADDLIDKHAECVRWFRALVASGLPS